MLIGCWRRFVGGRHGWVSLSWDADNAKLNGLIAKRQALAWNRFARRWFFVLSGVLQQTSIFPLGSFGFLWFGIAFGDVLGLAFGADGGVVLDE